MKSNTLFVIPARGGSKGVSNKNLRLLNEKPLIWYSIEETKKVASVEDICFTSDSDELIDVAKSYGLEIPFVRPKDLASDTATTRSVLLHAIENYQNIRSKTYELVVLIQPTSPLRKAGDILNCLNLYQNDLDMVVSVVETKSNPYYVLFEEDENGYLRKSKPGEFTRRQDCPNVYEFNGAVYVINIQSLKHHEITQMVKIIKYIMPEERSIDIDTKLDFLMANYILHSSDL